MNFSARLSEVHWGDAPAWAAVTIAILALIISAWSAALSWKSLRWERQSADAAVRSAEAAERSNRLTERILETRGEVGAVADSATATGGPTAPPPDVSWRIEHPSGNRYVLRNTGTDIADHVEVDPSQAGPVTRNLPKDAVIRPGEGVDMLILGAFGHPVPNQLYIRWGGQPEWVAVPMPG